MSAISMRLFVALALSVAIGLAFFLSPYASTAPGVST